MKVRVSLRELKNHLKNSTLSVDQIINALKAQNPDMHLQLELNMALSTNMIEAFSRAFDEEEGKLEFEINMRASPRPRAEGFGDDEDLERQEASQKERESVAEQIDVAVNTPLAAAGFEAPPIDSFDKFQNCFISYIEERISYINVTKAEIYISAEDALESLRPRVLRAFPGYQSMIEACRISKVKAPMPSAMLHRTLENLDIKLLDWPEGSFEYNYFSSRIQDFKSIDISEITLATYNRKVADILAIAKNEVVGDDKLFNEILLTIKKAKAGLLIESILQQINSRIFQAIELERNPYQYQEALRSQEEALSSALLNDQKEITLALRNVGTLKNVTLLINHLSSNGRDAGYIIALVKRALKTMRPKCIEQVDKLGNCNGNLKQFKTDLAGIIPASKLGEAENIELLTILKNRLSSSIYKGIIETIAQEIMLVDMNDSNIKSQVNKTLEQIRGSTNEDTLKTLRMIFDMKLSTANLLERLDTANFFLNNIHSPLADRAGRRSFAEIARTAKSDEVGSAIGR